MCFYILFVPVTCKAKKQWKENYPSICVRRRISSVSEVKKTPLATL